MEPFIKFIRAIISIDETDLALVLSKCREKTVPKGKFILKKGQIATQYFFIVSGGVRFYYGEPNQQNTSWLVFNDEFFTDISSLSPQKPSRFNIEAIEDTELIVLDKPDMDLLYSRVPAWQEFGRKLWEQMAARMVNRIVGFQTQSAEERYLQFMNTPELLQKVPIKHVASFLGVTPNALSRIRKKLR